MLQHGLRGSLREELEESEYAGEYVTRTTAYIVFRSLTSTTLILRSREEQTGDTEPMLDTGDGTLDRLDVVYRG